MAMFGTCAGSAEGKLWFPTNLIFRLEGSLLRLRSRPFLRKATRARSIRPCSS